MAETVLDASALLALLGGEPGADAVTAVLPGAVVGAVNLAEVVSVLADRGMPVADIRSALDGLALDVRSFDIDTAYDTGALRPATRKLGLSLGDRACLALGTRLGASILTTERAWKALARQMKIQVIR